MDVFKQRVQGRDFSMHFTFFDLQALHPEDTLCLAADRRSFCTFIFGCSLFIFYRKQRAEFGGPTVLLLIIKQHIFFRIHYYGILFMAHIIIPVHRRDRNGGATPLVILELVVYNLSLDTDSRMILKPARVRALCRSSFRVGMALQTWPG